MDDLPDEEIEGIWLRVQRYINVNSIQATDKRGIADELERLIRQVNVNGANPQARGSFLTEHGFHKRVVELEPVYSLFFIEKIKTVRVTSKTGKQYNRHQYKGAPIRLSNGKTIKSGQFVSGKSESEVIKLIRERQA